MKIDFVSDVACPWCAVGLYSLEAALRRLGDDVDVELHFQPFELNPTLAPEGRETVAYLVEKYGSTPERVAQNREAIRQRGAEVGFSFGERPWVWNTFDAHRMLHWAGLEGKQRELKHALLKAYHGDAENPGATDVLLRLAGEVGLDVERARQILESDEYANEVRALERHWQQLGISAVPSMIINDRHLIQGGQPPEVIEQALRQLAQPQQQAS
ncbi:DsbA family oxidoreductase [Piscinibacter sakaiensis]|uniref:DsbA family oxidoreductase n=1 Tax=Piscinibacter sakaiensis TaxID=1547922 RepID=UPI003AACEFED